MTNNLDKLNYVETSAADDGHFVGRDPRKMAVETLRAIGGSSTPVKAIRSKCMDCCVGSAGEVRKCVTFKCALWPFRMGVSPFYGRSAAAEEAAN